MIYAAYIATDRHAVLAYPHYTRMDIWRGGQLIYGEQVQTDTINYADRLWREDWDRAEHASTVCSAEGLQGNTAAYIERWLSVYHERPVTLRYVIGGVNWSNGYNWYFYGYDYEVKA